MCGLKILASVGFPRKSVGKMVAETAAAEMDHKQLEQLERLHSEDTPPVKVTKLKNLQILQSFEFLNKHCTRQTDGWTDKVKPVGVYLGWLH